MMAATTRQINNRMAANRMMPLDYTDIIDQFKDEMAANGVIIRESIIADGRLHRYHVEGDRLGSKNAAVILHLDGNPAGFYQYFKTGITRTWRADGKRQRLSHADRLAMEIEQKQRQDEILETQRKAAIKAVNIWRDATPVINHPYLEKKQIQAHQLRISRSGTLLVPIYNEACLIVNLQFIDAEGEKRFLSGGRKSGCFSVVGTHANNETILIAEGLATACSLNEHSDLFTVVALDCGNLKPVAQVWRQLRPNAKIVVCGDNDLNEIGQTKAREAALACQGTYLIPEAVGCDWNDTLINGGSING
jgi:putative DNA primase/helicase